MRTLAIGDIHGGLKALTQVLKRANVTSDDTLIFLGDYVDGWSESAELIAFLIDLRTRQQCIFIRGNHDVWCHEWLLDGHIPEVWYIHGGKETLESYARVDYDKEQHVQFYNNLENYYIDSQNRLFLHAGFTAIDGVEKEVFYKNFFFDRTLIETALLAEKLSIENLSNPKYALERFDQYTEIYIGHTPTIKFNRTTPTKALNLWNVDTGAAFTGKLSILDIDTKEFWQSDPLPELYPTEKGRNQKPLRSK
ncbi:serine/threonine protein phosphatase 1 [Kordia periserrulae]|uniref:Serine/threonine protein phosphatase 1 n=1 Tax=Kordia periserrulae TaxID=701523 RepID=A0A2T6BX59_9FLAO|nr:metallophosphoesterase family protein [Kordia periserrulae]PTX60626.1 serine/threonine protein phosphatase 1 [Kordia periserrulae]